MCRYLDEILGFRRSSDECIEWLNRQHEFNHCLFWHSFTVFWMCMNTFIRIVIDEASLLISIKAYEAGISIVQLYMTALYYKTGFSVVHCSVSIQKDRSRKEKRILTLWKKRKQSQHNTAYKHFCTAFSNGMFKERCTNYFTRLIKENNARTRRLVKERFASVNEWCVQLNTNSW